MSFPSSCPEFPLELPCEFPLELPCEFPLELPCEFPLSGVVSDGQVVSRPKSFLNGASLLLDAQVL